jgi:hypothetical protein
MKCQTKTNSTFWRQFIDSKASSYEISSYSIDSCLQRKSSGFICISNCSTLAKCVYQNNEWNTIPMQVCSQGSYCNEKEQTCSESPGECQLETTQDVKSKENFTCSSEGVL